MHGPSPTCNFRGLSPVSPRSPPMLKTIAFQSRPFASGEGPDTPVLQRIHYIGSPPLCPWHCAYLYLLELFILTSSCAGRQSLRSAFRGDSVVPHARTAIKQHRAFSIVGPSVWNSLPSEIRSLPRDLSSSFCKLLKTFIFARALAGSASE